MKLKRLAAAFVAGMMAMLTLAGCSTISIEGNDQPAAQNRRNLPGRHLYPDLWRLPLYFGMGVTAALTVTCAACCMVRKT